MLHELLSFLQRMSLPYPTNFAMIDDELFLGNYPDVIFDPSGICDNEVVCSYMHRCRGALCSIFICDMQKSEPREIYNQSTTKAIDDMIRMKSLTKSTRRCQGKGFPSTVSG